MAYNSQISRSVAQPLVPEVISDAILARVTTDSAAMSLFRKIPMSTNQTRMPVLAALPVAYFVNGDTGLKQTTEVDWTNKYLNVEELATIVPVPENVMDDVAFDIWGGIEPLIAEAIGRALDAAVFFGVNKPASWPNAIVTDATNGTTGNTVARGTNAAAAGGIAGDFSDLFGKVEADGYDVNGVIAATSYRGRLRQARATTGESLWEITQQVSQGQIFGVDVRYPMRGLWGTTTGSTEAIVGDFTQGILGVRKDITLKILDQAVIQDNTGAIQYNLAQQDMIALRVTARFAFQVANVINYDQPDGTKRYPFAAMTAP